MDAIIKTIILVLCSARLSRANPCPCYEESLCEPLTIKYEQELYVFSTAGPKNYKLYDWDKITTVAVFGDWSDDLFCIAHETGARVVLGATFPVDQLLNETYKNQWMREQLTNAYMRRTDGINLDFEFEVAKGSQQYYALTELVKNVTEMFHEAINGSQVSLDVPWGPNCVYERCYDYLNLAKTVDFLVIMAYDELSQSGAPYRAGANSPWGNLVAGVDQYLSLGINTSELVVAFPWYGYNFVCLKKTMPFETSMCTVQADEDAIKNGFNAKAYNAVQNTYDYIAYNLFPLGTSPVKYDETTQSAYFKYVQDGVTHEVWFDDSVSLKPKYWYVLMYKQLRGTGMWHADCAPNLDFYGISMWSALPSIK